MDWPHFRRLAPHAPADDRSGVVGDHHSDFQPRVPPGDPSGDGGQWTKGAGVTGAAAALAAPALETGPAIGTALRGLATAAASLGGTALLVAGGLILIPFNRSQKDAGLLPDDPNVHYDYDQGFLTVRERMPDGSWDTLFHGRPDSDGYYATPDGAMIGRALDNGVYLSAASIRLEKRGRTKSRATARTQDEPRYCPNPGFDSPGRMSERSQLYQTYITTLPPGIAVRLNGVVFDGCDEIRRIMLEAKGEGYEWALDDSDFFEWFWGRERLLNQMVRQSLAAGDRLIEWHVAEERVAKVLERLAVPFENIIVRWTPPPWRLKESGK